jgi:1-phosphofructokinase
MSIVTVTLNPAVDETVRLERLERGAVHRALDVRHDPGGKGVNVACCLADWGLPVTATGFLGADNARLFETMFAAKGIRDRFVRVPGATRVNIKLVDATETTDINLPGLRATPEALAALDSRLSGLGRQDLAVLGGSLPAGCADGQYAAMVASLGRQGVRVLLDASGPSLDAALGAPVLPWCVKPNRHELAAWAGKADASVTELVAAAGELRRRGVALAVVSMDADGAFFFSDEGALWARLPAAAVASTVGAGDAMVAGIAAASERGGDLERVARLATAFAVAKLGRVGPNLPGPETVESLAGQVELTEITTKGAVYA